MSSEIITPSGSYNRIINEKEKTFLIFEYSAHTITYKNYSIELPKGFKSNEIFAIHDGLGNLELITNKETPF